MGSPIQPEHTHYDRGSVDHVIAIHSVKRERVWPEEFVPRLRLLGEIFVNVLERKHDRLRLEEQLRFETLIAEISGVLSTCPPIS